jgi:circadian clock protein KaiC
MSEAVSDRAQERISTGIAGLDAVLHGGLLRRGVYMVQGKPGGGKTILANQLCFHHVAQGGRVVYATLLTEAHERMLFNLGRLAFFDASRVPEQLTYVSAYSTLEEGGLKGLTELLRRETRARKATVLVVDGLVAVSQTASSEQEFKKFIHELQIQATLLGCTLLLLTTAGADVVGPEHTMVDGVLEVSDHRLGRSLERELEVKKFRGSAYVRGAHTFQITDAGIVLYPRLEGMLWDPSPADPCKTERLSTGLEGLDRMTNGGLRCATSSLLFGNTGVGKTTLGLHFLDRSSPEEPGLHFGFYEPPPRLMFKAHSLGLDLESKCKQGVLDILWHPPTERLLDALGHKLLANVRERGVKRLFVDGIDGFIQAAAHPERIYHFLAALTHELRTLGVTTVYTAELHDLFASEVRLPMQGISSLLENIFLLRFVEHQARIARLFSVVKLRDSDYDHTMRELHIAPGRTRLGQPLDSGSSVVRSKLGRLFGKRSSP